MQINEDECRAAGIDPSVIKQLARAISQAGLRAKKLGLTIFGGSGSGTLRMNRSEIGSHSGAMTGEQAYSNNGPLILADLDGSFDGGNGACGTGADGLMRGE